jgi:hypothetical protein
MYLFHLLRSFLPLHNPIGFGAADFVEFSLAALLVLLLYARARLAPAIQRLAPKTGWCMLLFFLLVVILRLALFPSHPVPVPSASDSFSYLLLGDTLAHFRLANPPLPLHQFFETTFVLQEPSYSSIYPLGGAIPLALGQLLFRVPWAGVLLSMGLLAALCYWMLRGWMSPGWAFVGGLLAVIEFGPLNSWMNSYWGGAVSAIAGCLVFGALPRLRESGRTRDAALLGLGLGLQMLARPFESILLDLSAALFFLPELRRREWPRLARFALPAVAALLPAFLLLVMHNKAVTGSWTTLPYGLSRYQYGVPTTFTFQPNPVPHNKLTQAQRLYYEGQAMVHVEAGGYFERLGSRAGFYRFFLLTPLLLSLPFFLLRLRDYRYAWIAISVLIFALGTNVYPYFFPQYIAALTCVFLLICLLGLERLSEFRSGPMAARWILALCGAHFLFWYGLQKIGDEPMLRAMVPYETADNLNFGDPEKRAAINRRLEEAPGGQLVFVRYFSTHAYQEWIHNAADPGSAKIIWALEQGADENAELQRRYPGRTVWLLEPDAIPPKLIPYPANKGPFLTVQ